jgi:hypothetical protein
MEAAHMTSNEAAYLAGVIDGEGHISLTRKKLPHCRWPTFGARIGIANTNKEWLESFQQLVGGWLRQVGTPTLNRKPCYSLVFEGSMLVGLLSAVQPFLRLKQRQAAGMLLYFDLAARRRAQTVLGQSSPSDVIEALEALYLEQKQLNWRGVSKVASKRNAPKGRKCGVTGCDQSHFGRGYCNGHYKKFIVRGGPKQHVNVCTVCGSGFPSKRSDAKFCSSRCRIRFHRSAPSLS